MVVKHLSKEHKFVIELGSAQAYLIYRKIDEHTLDAYTTFVPNSARGKGIAKALTDELVKYAMQKGFRIKPSCSYVSMYFQKNQGLSNLVVS